MNVTNTDGQKRAERIAEHLLELGSGFAVYGLEAGKIALEHAGETLIKTAKLLDTIAETLAEKHAAEDKSDAASAEEAPADKTPPAA